MKSGIILAQKARGDVYFINMKGKSILPPSKNVEVPVKENFFGETLHDAVQSARRYAIGAIREKVAQKMRGHNCRPVVENIRISYLIKQGFSKSGIYQRLLNFKMGDCILKRGDRGSEFFLVREGIVDINGIEYGNGDIFGRAAFNDGIRKMDAFAKTDVTLVAIDKKHPDIRKKLKVIIDKFAEESESIRKIRPQAEIDTIFLT